MMMFVDNKKNGCDLKRERGKSSRDPANACWWQLKRAGNGCKKLQQIFCSKNEMKICLLLLMLLVGFMIDSRVLRFGQNLLLPPSFLLIFPFSFLAKVWCFYSPSPSFQLSKALLIIAKFFPLSSQWYFLLFILVFEFFQPFPL